MKENKLAKGEEKKQLETGSELPPSPLLITKLAQKHHYHVINNPVPAKTQLNFNIIPQNLSSKHDPTTFLMPSEQNIPTLAMPRF